MKKTLILLLLLSQIITFAQKTDGKGLAILVNMHYGLGFPSQDLATRFGNHSSTGGGIELMTDKGRWILGTDFSYIFGKKVTDNPVAGLYNVENYIYGNNKELGVIFLRERAFVMQGYVGKLIPIHPSTGRAGLRLTLGAGYMQHKIRVQDDGGAIVQVAGDYAKGYDRLSGGFTITQSIGYQYLSQNRRINFILSLEANQAFTKSLRDWDFATKRKDDAQRKDFIFGARATWILPFYLGDNGEKDSY
jgi:hypothetical protein